MIDLNKTILITGANGFIGSNLTRSLILKGYSDIHIIIRKSSNLWRLKDIKHKLQISYISLLNEVKLKKFILEIKPNIIFHLSAGGTKVGQNGEGLNELFQINTIGTINLINSCKNIGFDYFINTGSSSEYGEKNVAMSETDILEPNNEYGITKASATMYASFIGKKYNLPIYTFRLFAVYGYFEDKNRLIATVILNYIKGLSPKLSNKESVRDFIFIDDIIEIYLNIDRINGDFGGIYNLGNGKQYKISKIVELIKKIANSKIEPIYGIEKIKQNEPKVWLANNSKISNIFGKSNISIEKGLEKTYIWFKKNIDIYN